MDERLFSDRQKPKKLILWAPAKGPLNFCCHCARAATDFTHSLHKYYENAWSGQISLSWILMTMINRTDVDEVINELSSRQTGRRVLSKSQSQEDDAIAGGKAACLITDQHFHSYYWFKDDLLDGNRISWIYENIHNHNENGQSARWIHHTR